MIQSAIDAVFHIHPIAILYPHYKERTHLAAPYFGDMAMINSLSNILSAKTLRAEVHFLDVISTTGKSRDELAREAEEKVRAVIENA